MNYPLKQKIEDCLERKKKLKSWLKDELKVSEKTLYNFKEINDLSLQMILKLSKALDFNFLEDYNNWLRETHEPAIGSWNDSEIIYNKETRSKMTLTFSVRGDQKTMGNRFGNVLEALKKECDNHGLEIV